MANNGTSGSEENNFHWADYLVFGVSLSISLGIGIFFAIRDRKTKSTEEFLMGGRSLHFVPVGLSLLASILNGVFIIGIPAEIHYFGAVYSLLGIGLFLTLLVVNTFYIPTFHKMNITSAYEYFDRRYGFKPLRIAMSLTFLLAMLFFLAVVLYAPALAFSEVTDMELYVAILSCGLVCTVYTGFGGMKAVVWTDTVQVCIIVIGVITLSVRGIYHDDIGGPGEVLERVKANGRWDFGGWDPDPRTRTTVWTQTIGQFVIWTSVFATNQMTIQRYLATTTARNAQLAMTVAIAGSWVLLALVVILGFTMNAYYSNKCDPLIGGVISKGDQLVPRFLMEILGEYHGLPGLFTAAVFAAALSSVSSAMNSMAAVVLEDYVKPLHKHRTGNELSMPAATKLSKAIAIFFGLATVGLSFAAKYMGEQIVEIPPTIWGTVGAPMLGCFYLGFFVSWSTGLGSFIGLIVSLGISLWMCIGGVVESSERKPMMPLGTNCPGLPLGPPANQILPPERDLLQDFYDISYAWYGVIGFLVQVIVGLFCSAIENWCRPRKLPEDPSLMYNCATFPCCGLLCYFHSNPADTKPQDQSSGDNAEIKYQTGVLTDSGGVSNPAFTHEHTAVAYSNGTAYYNNSTTYPGHGPAPYNSGPVSYNSNVYNSRLPAGYNSGGGRQTAYNSGSGGARAYSHSQGTGLVRVNY